MNASELSKNNKKHLIYQILPMGDVYRGIIWKDGDIELICEAHNYVTIVEFMEEKHPAAVSFQAFMEER